MYDYQIDEINFSERRAAAEVYQKLKNRKSNGLNDNNLSKFHSMLCRKLRDERNNSKALDEIKFTIKVHKEPLKAANLKPVIKTQNGISILNMRNGLKVRKKSSHLELNVLSTTCTSLESSLKAAVLKNQISSSAKIIDAAPISPRFEESK